MIVIDSVSKIYRSGRGKVQALANVSCSLSSGTALALVGKSGSGKTSLLHCIDGLARPDTSTVQCFGQDIYALSRRALALFLRRNIGFVFQAANLLSYLDVQQNIAMPLALNNESNKRQNERVLALLERVGLHGYAKAMPRELSGGETQRVAFARAIAHSPRLLLADEPTASLDSISGGSLIELMLQMVSEQGGTLLIGTHDPVVMGRMQGVLHLRDGALVDEAASSTL